MTLSEENNQILQTHMRIRQAREVKGLSQKDMAEMLEMAQPNYQRLETGKTQLTVETLCSVAQVLQMPVSLLLFDSMPNQPSNLGSLLESLQQQLHDLQRRVNELEHKKTLKDFKL